MRDFTLENPIRAIREISHDLTGRRTVRLANGREASALDIQREYYAEGRGLRRAPRARRRRPPSRSLDLWGRTLDAVETGTSAGRHRDRLGDQAQLIERYQRASTTWRCRTPGSPSSTWPTTTSTAAAACYDLLERKGLVDRVTTDQEIFEAKATPAADHPGQAARRVHPAAQEKRRDFTVDWVHLKLNDQAQRTVLCKDPFRSVDERVERLIQSM